MESLEKQLNSLPKAKLGLKADLRIRFALYRELLKRGLPVFGRGFLLKPAAALAILALLVACIVPGYAYASGNVTRGSFLYPVKLAVEQVELKLAINENFKAETLAKFSLRRLSEAKVLAEKDGGSEQEDNLKKTIDEAVALHREAGTAYDNAGHSAAESGPDGKVGRLEEKSESALKTVAQTVGLDADDELIDKISLAMEDVRNGRRKTPAEPEPENESLSEETEATGTIQKQPEDQTEKPETGENYGKENHENIKTLKPESSPDKNGGTEKNAADNKKEDAINDLKTEVDKLKTEVRGEEFRPGEVEKLFDHLDRRVKKLEDEKKATPEDVNSAKAFTVNAKYFMNKRRSGKKE